MMHSWQECRHQAYLHPGHRQAAARQSWPQWPEQQQSLLTPWRGPARVTTASTTWHGMHGMDCLLASRNVGTTLAVGKSHAANGCQGMSHSFVAVARKGPFMHAARSSVHLLEHLAHSIDLYQVTGWGWGARLPTSMPNWPLRQ